MPAEDRSTCKGCTEKSARGRCFITNLGVIVGAYYISFPREEIVFKLHVPTRPAKIKLRFFYTYTHDKKVS